MNASSPKKLEVISPIDGVLLSHVPMSGSPDLDLAVAAAKKAFPACHRDSNPGNGNHPRARKGGNRRTQQTARARDCAVRHGRSFSPGVMPAIGTAQAGVAVRGKAACSFRIPAFKPA